jgi:hypothetical protein
VLNSFITNVHGVKVGQSFELGERLKSDSSIDHNVESVTLRLADSEDYSDVFFLIQCHHMSVMDLVVSSLVVAEV